MFQKIYVLTIQINFIHSIDALYLLEKNIKFTTVIF